MDISLATHRSYIGKPALDLPTPSLVISRSTLERNIKKLHDDVENLGLMFRPHVKTLKSAEVTRMMLAGGRYRKAIASTLREIEGLVPLVKERILDECLYGLPLRPGALPRLVELSDSIKIVLMVDNEQQIEHLETFASSSSSHGSTRAWDIFIKVDVGSHRAGLEPASSALKQLVQRAEASDAVSIYGFYCHSGHSYACCDEESVASVLNTELDGVLSASKLMSNNKKSDRPLVLSIGSTPTAHSIRAIKDKFPENVELELHAGNFPANDLQQVSTGLVEIPDQALRVLTEVCSVYKERNQALVNAGVIALSKETSARFPGFGRVTTSPDWHVIKLSQEHGILGLVGEDEKQQGDSRPSVEEGFCVGQKVFLYCQHACITAAAHYVYYVVDENDVVCDTWIPWKGW
ncbi:hypothetical protein AJ80_03151 [Polytolypa hystricis UAMH7299]|uniref:D-serine dehydratase n=1 Tax=Polytolypa hystricis (strain UAMH7299) TaxID=1447883 RepID=A0A2B7YKE8_POLH7|nr:hypothetical protein AJ80_03151 [Polytolypa hystricis UAMH7299]